MDNRNSAAHTWPPRSGLITLMSCYQSLRLSLSLRLRWFRFFANLPSVLMLVMVFVDDGCPQSRTSLPNRLALRLSWILVLLLSIACDCLILRCCSHPRSPLSIVRCRDHRPTFRMRLAADLVVVLNSAACDLVLLAVVACLRSQLHWPCSYEFRHDGLRRPRSTLRSRPQRRCRIVLAPKLPDFSPSVVSFLVRNKPMEQVREDLKGDSYVI